MNQPQTRIKINLERDALLTDQAKKLMHDYYMLPWEKSPQEAYARAAEAYCLIR
jgi:hypothetical protein